MVSPNEAMTTIKRALQDSDELPVETEYLLHEADQSGADSDVSLPLIEIQPVVSEWINVHNTDFAGFETDPDGNRIGRVYHSEYELDLQVDVWTAHGGNHDPDELGTSLRNALYPYTSHGPDETFEGDRGQDLDSIWYFSLGDGERADDLVQTPTLRRWRQEMTLWSYENFSTEEEYIVSVDYPSPGELSVDENGLVSDQEQRT